MIKADLLIVYWILFWYFVYIIGYINQNPKIALWIALVCDLFVLVSMIYYKAIWKHTIGFICFIAITKIIPIMSLEHTKITKEDVYATIGLYVMYVGWLLWENRMNMVAELYHEMFKKKGDTPLMLLLHHI